MKTQGATTARSGVARITAVVVATAATEDGAPAALLRFGRATLLGHLCDQLRAQGVSHLTVLTRPEWVECVGASVPAVSLVGVASLSDTLRAVATVAAEGIGPILVAQGEILTHDSVLAGLLLDPRVATGVASSGRHVGTGPTLRLRIERGRVVAAESAYHTVAGGSGSFLGLLKVSPTDRPALAKVASELAELTRDQLPDTWEPELAAKVQTWGVSFFRRNTPLAALAVQLERQAGSAKWLPDPGALRDELDRAFASAVLHPAAVAAEDAVSLLLTGLVRNGQVLTSTYLRDLYWSRPFSTAQAERARRDMAAVDEDRVLLDSAVKGSDGFFTTFFVSPYSRYIARWCARHGLTPNQVTSLSMLQGLLAASAFALGNRAGLVTGAILLQVAFTFDCVDGQLARYTRQFSKLGAWLDSVFDRGKEYVVYAGLAVGATRSGVGAGIWTLAAAALTLQTVRHSLDFSYAASEHQSISQTVQAPMIEPHERGKAGQADTVADVLPEQPDMEGHLGESDVVARRRDVRIRLSVLGRVGVRASRYFEQRAWMKWAKRILVLPIGERFALISITAAFFGPRVTFTALLTWGSLAVAYSLTGRVLRSVV